MNIISELKKIPLFKELNDDELQKVAEISIKKIFPGGSIIFREGESGDSLFLIIYGSVRILKTSERGEEEIVRLASGSVFGELALIDESQRSASAVAIENTELLDIIRDNLNNLIEENPKIGVKIYKAFSKLIASRLRGTTNDLLLIKNHLKNKHPGITN